MPDPRHPLSSGLSAQPACFYVGEWRVEPSLNRVSLDEQTVQLEPKVMEVLVHLAAHPKQVISRGALLQTLWPNTEVIEAALTRCISVLRKTFDDDAREPRFIETIRKTGYRLVAPVSFDYGGDAFPRQAPTLSMPPGLQPRRSIRPPLRAVLSGALILLLAITGIWLWQRYPTPTPVIQPLQPVPLTSFPGTEEGAMLSPDGQHVAFSWKGYDHQNRDIYLKLVGVETPMRLTHHPAPDHSPAWSPDGHRIAFMRFPTSGTCEIYVVPAIGGTEQLLGDCSYNIVTDLTWSPDGKWLAYSNAEQRHAVSRIVLFSPETREKRLLTSPQNTRYGDFAPSFSPDAKYLAFTRAAFDSRPDGHVDILVLEVATGQTRRLTSTLTDEWMPSWSQDGQWIYFGSDQSGMTAAESSDGQFLYYASNRGKGIWRRPVTGGAESPVFSGFNEVDWGSWVVVEDGIYFLQRERLHASLAFYRFAGGTVEPLARLTSTDTWNVTWSVPSLTIAPDGRSMLYTQYDRLESDIMLVEDLHPKKRG